MAEALKSWGGALFVEDENADSLKRGDTENDDDSDCCCKTCEECCPPNPLDAPINGVTVTISGIPHEDDERCHPSGTPCEGLNGTWDVPNEMTLSDINKCGYGTIYFCGFPPDGVDDCDYPPICQRSTPSGGFYREWLVSISWSVQCVTVGVDDVFRLRATLSMDGDSVTATGYSVGQPAQCVGLSATGNGPGGIDHGRCDFNNVTLTASTY